MTELSTRIKVAGPAFESRHSKHIGWSKEAIEGVTHVITCS